LYYWFLWCDFGCQYTPLNCDYNNACTVDFCDPATGCTHFLIVCDDHNACTTNSCDAQLGCQPSTGVVKTELFFMM